MKRGTLPVFSFWTIFVTVTACICHARLGEESASIIEAHNIELVENALCCRSDGYAIVTNAFANGKDWKFRNSENRLRYNVGTGQDGMGVLQVVGV